MLFHFFSRDCYAKFWNIWGIHRPLGRKRICREVFTLDKWTNMTYRRDPPAKIPAGEHLSPYMRRSMPHIADTHRDSEQPCSRDVSHSFSAGADIDHPDSAHCHPEAASAPSGSSISY
ncbi:hypothetical protein AAG906_001590 [Vitis piasezkii]